MRFLSLRGVWKTRLYSSRRPGFVGRVFVVGSPPRAPLSLTDAETSGAETGDPVSRIFLRTHTSPVSGVTRSFDAADLTLTLCPRTKGSGLRLYVGVGRPVIWVNTGNKSVT